MTPRTQRIVFLSFACLTLAATGAWAYRTADLTIDAQRNASKSAVMLTVKNGKVAFVESIDP